LASNVDVESSTLLDGGSLYTDTITVTGGQEDKFLNLDATANIYRLDTSGATANDASADYSIIYDSVNASSAERLVAENFDASESKADVIARFSTNITDEDGGQNITMGSGDDTVIFDYLGDTSAGLSIADKVDGGEGNDTLVIDGDLTGANNGDVIAISSSEWTSC